MLQNVYQKIYHNYLSVIGWTMNKAQTESLLSWSELEQYISSLSSSVDVNAVAWRSSRFGPLHLVIITRGLTLCSSQLICGLWCEVVALHPHLPQHSQLLTQTNTWLHESEAENEGLHQPGLVLPVCASVSFLVCLYFASVSSLNLLNHKKQVTAEAPYAGWLIKVVSVVKTTTNS